MPAAGRWPDALMLLHPRCGGGDETARRRTL